MRGRTKQSPAQGGQRGSVINYYERHLGDYAKAAGHLTMLEHGAYTLLMDRYYSTESGIPADQAYRLARARSDEERAAVDAVLNEFFSLVDGIWIKARIEEEIAKTRRRVAAAQVNGKKGGSPMKKAGYNEPGFLYAVQRVTGGAIKVGITKYPAARYSDLRGKVGEIVEIFIGRVVDMGAAEAAVHTRFADRLDGEWISATADEIVSACSAHSLPSTQPNGQRIGTPNRVPNTVTHQSPDTNHQAKEQKPPAPSPASQPPAEAVVMLPLNDGTEYAVTQAQVDEFAELYPAVDVVTALRKMRGWCIAKPKNRKTRRGVLAFVTAWLAKDQDAGGARIGATHENYRSGPAESLAQRAERKLREGDAREFERAGKLF